jgi:hypothetical protein
MFISHGIALAVAALAALGFLSARGFSDSLLSYSYAASHQGFVAIGAYVLKKSPQLLDNKLRMVAFAL